MRLYSRFGRNMNDIKSANSYFKKYGFGKKGRMHPLAAGLASIDLLFYERLDKTALIPALSHVKILS